MVAFGRCRQAADQPARLEAGFTCACAYLLCLACTTAPGTTATPVHTPDELVRSAYRPLAGKCCRVVQVAIEECFHFCLSGLASESVLLPQASISHYSSQALQDDATSSSNADARLQPRMVILRHNRPAGGPSKVKCGNWRQQQHLQSNRLTHHAMHKKESQPCS